MDNGHMDVTCDTCGETFEKKPAKVRDSDHDFCSRDCYQTWRREDWDAEALTTDKVAVECENCGDTFRVYPYRADSARFCDRDCKDDYMAGRSGKDTPAYRGAKETYVCQQCGGEFEEFPTKNDAEYCSKECYREASSEIFAGEGNPVWRGGRVDNYGPNWNDQRQRALERDGYRCQDCGKHADDMDRSPDVHHKKRLGWFKEEYDAPEWYEKGNELDNLVTLCQPCHADREGLGEGD